MPKCHCKFPLERCIFLRRAFSRWTIIRCSIHRDCRRNGLSHDAGLTASFPSRLLIGFRDWSKCRTRGASLEPILLSILGLIRGKCRLLGRDRLRPSKRLRICRRWVGLWFYWFTPFLLYLRHELNRSGFLRVVQCFVDFPQVWRVFFGAAHLGEAVVVVVQNFWDWLLVDYRRAVFWRGSLGLGLLLARFCWAGSDWRCLSLRPVLDFLGWASGRPSFRWVKA